MKSWVSNIGYAFFAMLYISVAGGMYSVPYYIALVWFVLSIAGAIVWHIAAKEKNEMRWLKLLMVASAMGLTFLAYAFWRWPTVVSFQYKPEYVMKWYPLSRWFCPIYAGYFWWQTYTILRLK